MTSFAPNVTSSYFTRRLGILKESILTAKAVQKWSLCESQFRPSNIFPIFERIDSRSVEPSWGYYWRRSYAGRATSVGALQMGGALCSISGRPWPEAPDRALPFDYAFMDGFWQNRRPSP